MGEATANVLAQHFKTLEAIQEATKDELLQVEGVGPQVADSIIKFFQNDKNQALMRKTESCRGLSSDVPGTSSRPTCR